MNMMITRLRHNKKYWLIVAVTVTCWSCTSINDPDAPGLVRYWLLDGYEAYAINGVHTNILGKSGSEIIAGIRLRRVGKLVLRTKPDLWVEAYPVGAEEGDIYGIWLNGGYVAMLPRGPDQNSGRVIAYQLSPGSLIIIENRLSEIEKMTRAANPYIEARSTGAQPT